MVKFIFDIFRELSLVVRIRIRRIIVHIEVRKTSFRSIVQIASEFRYLPSRIGPAYHISPKKLLHTIIITHLFNHCYKRYIIFIFLYLVSKYL